MKTEPQSSGWLEWIDRRAPHSYAILFWCLSVAIFWAPLNRVARLSFHDELASHIPVIPVISAVLLYLERRRIFGAARRYCPALGISLLVSAAVLWFGFHSSLMPLSAADRLSAEAALIAFVWIAGFVLFYGTQALRAALFPLLFLFLITPLPPDVTLVLTSALQKGSADVCYVLFRLLGVPVLRHDFLFSLPGVDIEVGQQCSGIHSGLSLLIAGLLAAHALLRSAWKKASFILCILPIAVFKNAVRIVTISWLGIHVSPDFFYGQLHREGGLPFSLLSLALMAILLWLLRRLSPPIQTAIAGAAAEESRPNQQRGADSRSAIATQS